MEIDNSDNNTEDIINVNNDTLKAKLRDAMSKSSTLMIIIPSIAIALSYMGTYVAKYPLFLVEYSDDDVLFNIPLKDWLSYAFTVGFFIGKWPAYKFVPSITRAQRPKVLVVLFVLTSILLTSLLPLRGLAFIKILSVLIGCICCSAIFGVEFLYFEGRANGDLYIGAVNITVFFGSSLCRAIGAALIQGGVKDNLMPFFFVMLYSPITAISLYCLDAIPNPSTSDVTAMGERTIMSSQEKSAFISNYIKGLSPLLIGYAYACGFRFLRDFYALECYRVLLKREPEPLDYLLADWIGGLIAITSLFAMSRVKDSGRALMLLHCLFIGGAMIVGVALFLFEREIITPEILIILVGVGMILSITPFSGSLMDRIMACTRTKGTATFLINFGDAFAYIGVFLSLAYKTSRSDDDSYQELFITGCKAFTLILLSTGILSSIYWARVIKIIAGYETVEVDDENTGLALTQETATQESQSLEEREIS